MRTDKNKQEQKRHVFGFLSRTTGRGGGLNSYKLTSDLSICLKIAKRCRLHLDIFICVKINVFCSFFAFMLEVRVRCDNQYKTGADGGNILGQPMLFECMCICVLRPAHES